MQWLDDLDDLLGAIGLVGEKIRNAAFSLAFLCTSLAVQIGGILLALTHPPLALASALLMFVVLLYRSVTTLDLSVDQHA